MPFSLATALVSFYFKSWSVPNEHFPATTWPKKRYPNNLSNFIHDVYGTNRHCDLIAVNLTLSFQMNLILVSFCTETEYYVPTPRALQAAMGKLVFWWWPFFFFLLGDNKITKLRYSWYDCPRPLLSSFCSLWLGVTLFQLSINCKISSRKFN